MIKIRERFEACWLTFWLILMPIAACGLGCGDNAPAQREGEVAGVSGAGEPRGGDDARGVAGAESSGGMLAGASVDLLPSQMSCEGSTLFELSLDPREARLTGVSDRSEFELIFNWGEDPLSRLIWRDERAQVLTELDESLPWVELSCISLDSLKLSEGIGDEALASRRMVSPPIVLTPRVAEAVSDRRWIWRRPARIQLQRLVSQRDDLSDLKLADLEVWWWPLRGEPQNGSSLESSLGKPVRVMLRNPSGRVARREDPDVALAFDVDEWGVYTVMVRTDEPAPRPLNYRAIVGLSMGGGAAAHIGVRHPERFDFVGAMGGPSDWLYMVHYVSDRLLSGFCEGDQIGSFCGTGPVRQPLEQYSDFLNFIYSNNGSDFDRGRYVKIFQDVVFALGNPTTYNPVSPYLPPGVPADDLLRSRGDRCAPECEGGDCDADLDWISIPQFYDDQFNPTGEWPVILFCDGETGGGAQGVWAPGSHDTPVELFLAVDLNDNGRRDEGEPIIQNLSEPFEDVGCDGLKSVDERGYDPLFNPDPAGDDFHWLYNPFGTEGDKLFEGAGGDVGLSLRAQLPEGVRMSDRADLEVVSDLLNRVACPDDMPGEPYQDTGLDGVPLTPQIEDGGFDWGESNGSFDYNPNKISYIANTASLWLARTLSSERGGPRFWIDGGIRDVMNFVVAGMYLAGRLHHQSDRAVVLYDSFESALGRGAFLPNSDDHERLENTGEHVLLRYGKLDATPAEIDAGDGGHVGTDADAVSRLNGALHWIMRGWMKGLGLDAPTVGRSSARVESASVDSDIFGGAYRFEVALPAGYDDPDNRDVSYPVVYFLHGYGQRARNFTVANVVLNALMLSGTWPATIFVYPDGACSDMILFACNDGVDNDADGLVDLDDPGCDDREDGSSERDDGERSSRCSDGVDNDVDGLIDLDDPGCLEASHDDEGECREGTFYLNHVVGKDGISRGRDYEGAFLDMMDYVELHYRVR